MRVKLLQTGEHAPWQETEIITVQVVAIRDLGEYDCETLETYPPDLKDQHAAVIERIHKLHQEELDLRDTKHAEIVNGLVAEVARWKPVDSDE